jgi:Holliday junction resolvase RusA-like endonuclease
MSLKLKVEIRSTHEASTWRADLDNLVPKVADALLNLTHPNDCLR